MPTANAQIKDEDVLRLARTRFAEAAEGWRDIYAEAELDLQFLAGKHWDDKTLHERKIADRPALVINKLPTFWAQVANEARKNKPAIKVSPIDSKGDKDTADVYQGLIRHIEYSSDSDIAYNTAFEYAVGCGIGFYKITSDYCDDRSFDQDLKIEAIQDPFRILIDPSSKKADRSDMRWAFEVEDLTEEEFKDRWPDSDTATSNFYADGLPYDQDWIGQKKVRVALYWYSTPRKRTLLELSTGENVYEDEIGAVPAPVTVERTREVITQRLFCDTINGAEVLEHNEYDGDTIPILAVTGKEIWVRGKRMIFSLIRFARDPQQLYNYYKTAQAEAVQLAPKAPWIVAEGQLQGYEELWQRANTVNYAYLTYRPVSLQGQPVPEPKRNVWEPPIQALSMGAREANDDIKATMGIFDASIGAKSNETSGVAIQRRVAESDSANYHFLDNLARTQRRAGRILCQLIPLRYDTEREVRIIGEDEAERVVRVNQAYIDEAGKNRHYKLDVGKYDVTVSLGPSYNSKREDSFDFMTQLVHGNPQLVMMIGDLMFRNSDAAGADQIADRMKQIIGQQNPNLQLDDQDQQKTVIPPQIQAQMQALTQQHEQLTQALQQATETINSKRLELESRERIAALQTKAALITTEAKLASAEGLALLQHDIARIETQIEAMFNGQAAQQPQQPQELPQAA